MSSAIFPILNLLKTIEQRGNETNKGDRSKPKVQHNLTSLSTQVASNFFKGQHQICDCSNVQKLPLHIQKKQIPTKKYRAGVFKVCKNGITFLHQEEAPQMDAPPKKKTETLFTATCDFSTLVLLVTACVKIKDSQDNCHPRFWLTIRF